MTQRTLARGLRTTYCAEVTELPLGTKISVCGWADRRREHGEHLAFVDLRDHTGVLQCVVDGQVDVRSEYVLRITGTLQTRPQDTENESLATGKLEIRDCQVEVLNLSQTPPFSLHGTQETEETTRLRHRYLDLRRPRMQKNIRTRAKVNSALRSSMEQQGFVEVETPMLVASTPEGARDFVVPSRLHAGSFYALPQSPQIFKQLCMVGGIDRYYQIARCLRDEDLRSDRQLEFMQLDLEASFVGQAEVIEFVSAAVRSAHMAVLGEEPGEMVTMTWQEAMDRFGTDKPDLRFGMELTDLAQVFAQTEAKVFQAECIKGINVPGGAEFSRNRIDDLTKKSQSWGAKGLAWFRVDSDRSPDGALTRFMSTKEQTGMLDVLEAKTGDLALVVADTKNVVNSVLGQLRLEVLKDIPELLNTNNTSTTTTKIVNTGSSISGGTGGDTTNSISVSTARNTARGTTNTTSTASHNMRYVWVVDFPLFEGWDKGRQNQPGRPIPAHHPFTSPHPDDMSKLYSPDPAELLQIRSLAYDLVLNGWELGSGSVRIITRELQSQIFSLLGIPPKEAERRFGFLLDAFNYGAPPHAGFALGIDRLTSLLLGEETIREVVAFPKTQSGADPLTGAPTPIDDQHLRDLGITVPDLEEADLADTGLEE